MALEDLTGTKYINSLNSSNPTATDSKSEGDDHLRGIKNVLKLSFPNISGAMTATHTELNILDGATVTTAEINILDGVTATAAELNILDGVTATAAELNILDGVTATAAELNILDGVTATAAELNILDGVTSTTAELNILDGVTATASEINRLDGTVKEVQENLGIYAGYVDSSAAAEVVPTGWSVTSPATGRYRITHNLGLSTPASDLIVTATLLNPVSDDRYCIIDQPTANTVDVIVYDISSAALANDSFHFMAIKLS